MKLLRAAVAVVALGMVVLTVGQATLAQVFRVPSASMRPLLHEGDRIVAMRPWWGDLRRGDVVVFDARGSFVPGRPRTGPLAGRVLPIPDAQGDVFFVKRVIGLPGDRVRCCSADGRLEIDGAPQAEPYLYPEDAASTDRFEVEVPPGRLWVMGDHRSSSVDSRAFLGRPGGGFVPTAAVVGRVVAIMAPSSRIRRLDRVDGPGAVPRAGPDAPGGPVSAVSVSEAIGRTR